MTLDRIMGNDLQNVVVLLPSFTITLIIHRSSFKKERERERERER